MQSPIKLADLVKMTSAGVPTFRSSKVFQPEKYLKTRGLSVNFGNSKQQDNVSPLAQFRNRSRSVPASPVGKRMSFAGFGQVSTSPLRRGSDRRDSQKV